INLEEKMSYGTVVKELARILGDRIIAYDNLPDHCGCILHISGPIKRIDIEIQALDEGASDLAAFVRECLAAPSANLQRVGIGLPDEALTLLTDSRDTANKQEGLEAHA